MEGFFALSLWGAYIWRGLYMEGLIFGILRYSHWPVSFPTGYTYLSAWVFRSLIWLISRPNIKDPQICSVQAERRNS